MLSDPIGLRQVYATLRGHVASAQDTLLVYYAGHGLKSPRNELYLTLADTDPDELATTGLSFDLIRELLLSSPATNKILILDCCFSGSAISTMTSQSAIVGQLTVAGAYILASVPANAVALAPEGAPYTAFTGELLSLLYQGIPGGHELLTIGDLYPRLVSTMASHGLPRPERQGTGTVEHLGLVRNRAHETHIADLAALSVAPLSSPAGVARQALVGQASGAPTGLEYFQALEAKAIAHAAAVKAAAEREAGIMRTAAEREAAEMRVQARREADTLRADADREAKQLRTYTSHEAAELKATVEREVAALRATAEREITQLRAKAAREAEEKRAEASKMLADTRGKRDKDLQALLLELAERREISEREESQRHSAAVAATQKLVGEAEERARAAEARAKEIEQRAEVRRIESERAATETVEKARAIAEKFVNEARAEAQRLVREARQEGQMTLDAARREIEDLTRKKRSITDQLTWVRSLLDEFAQQATEDVSDAERETRDGSVEQPSAAT